ncbi:hypothetical protein HYT05_03200 [Candidatus Kaiserbacteria bacterium]|nr:hypothetical protein [Candidatus Kaiserbacteria bacterium]
MHASRISSITASLGLVYVITPDLVYAAAPKNLVELANMLAAMFNSGATFLVLLAVILFFSGVTVSLFNKGEGKINGEKFKQMLLWGISILFVMVSIWGIIRLLQETLFGNSNSGGNNSTNTLPPSGGSAPLSFPNSTVL